MTKVQFRRLVVRMIEDTLFLLFVVVCIWLVCSGVSLALDLLGVA